MTATGCPQRNRCTIVVRYGSRSRPIASTTTRWSSSRSRGDGDGGTASSRAAPWSRTALRAFPRASRCSARSTAVLSHERFAGRPAARARQPRIHADCAASAAAAGSTASEVANRSSHAPSSASSRRARSLRGAEGRSGSRPSQGRSGMGTTPVQAHRVRQCLDRMRETWRTQGHRERRPNGAAPIRGRRTLSEETAWTRPRNDPSRRTPARSSASRTPPTLDRLARGS